MARNGSDILIESLIAWNVDVIFGLPGDGINGLMEAIRTRQDQIRFIQVRHEESSALMACAYAKITGRIGCCLATTGPGGIHLLNGLYEAKADGAPVLAITGLPYQDLGDTHTQQDVDHTKLFQDVALYSTRIMSAVHVENAVGLACRTALAQRGVTHLAISVDIQEQEERDAKRSPRNVAGHTSFTPALDLRRPPDADLDRAAELLNGAERVTILAGQGSLGARDELLLVAETLAAPIVKALLGKTVIPDAHPLTTGGVGLLGTRPSQDAMEGCDAILIVGSTFPYIEYYPKPHQARGVQIDRNAERIGLRFPCEVGLAGDAKESLRLLAKRLRKKTDRRFLQSIQASKEEWANLLHRAVEQPGVPMKPGRIARDLGERLAPDAIIAWDSGHNTALVARYIDAKPNQIFFGSGLMATMACSISYAVAAAIAFPDRQVIAFTGDGGLSMLLGELATIVRYRLPIKIIVIKNNSLAQIKWEQLQFLGNPEFECDLTPIDFVKVAEGFGIRGVSVKDPADCASVLDQALASSEAVLIEAIVDPYEPLLPPKRIDKYAENLEKALDKGTEDSGQINQALKREPSKTLLT